MPKRCQSEIQIQIFKYHIRIFLVKIFVNPAVLKSYPKSHDVLTSLSYKVSFYRDSVVVVVCIANDRHSFWSNIHMWDFIFEHPCY